MLKHASWTVEESDIGKEDLDDASSDDVGKSSSRGPNRDEPEMCVSRSYE